MKNLRKPEEIIIKGVSLKELLESHLKWLDYEETGKRLVLMRADLRNVYLKGADLEGVNLEGANLKKCKFRRCKILFNKFI